MVNDHDEATGPGSIRHPHDVFVRAVFDVATMAGFLQSYAPPGVVDRLDLATLEVAGPEFIDPDFSRSHADLLFKVATKSTGYLYVHLLLEHKSYVEPRTALQLLGYQTKIWGKPGPVYPVLPLVLYHGPQQWKVPTDFQGSIFPHLDDELKRFVPQYEYWICNLNDYTDDDLLVGPLDLQVYLTILKARAAHDLLGSLVARSSLIVNWTRDPHTSKERIELVFTYLADQSTSKTQYKQFETQLLNQGAEMPSVLEQAKQEGLEQGLEQAKFNIVQTMHHKGLTVVEIANLTGLEPNKIQQLLDEANR